MVNSRANQTGNSRASQTGNSRAIRSDSYKPTARYKPTTPYPRVP